MLRLRPAGFVEGQIEAHGYTRLKIVEHEILPTVKRPCRKEHVLIDKIGADEAEPAPMAANKHAGQVRCPFHATATDGASSI